MGRLFLASCMSLVACTCIQSQTYLGNFTDVTADGKSLIVHADSASVRIIFYQPDIVRIDFLPSTSSVPDSSFTVIRDTSTTISPTITETDSTLVASSSAMIVEIQKNPVRLLYYNASGKLLLAEPAAGGLSSDQSVRTANFVLASDDHFYGTGERGTSLDKRGLAFDSYNTYAGGYTQPISTMNTNIPFVASPKGYALFFDNTYEGWFDFGATSSSTFFYSAASGELTYYFIAASTVPEQLERYTWLTGRQPLPPRWAFGYIQSKYGYRNETEAMTMAQTMRQHQIPCDAIVLDLYWYSNMGDLAWNTSAWPNPFAMMDSLLLEGFETIVITEPYVTQYANLFVEGAANGYFGKYSYGAPYILSNFWACGCNACLVDMTNPSARSWWWSKHPSFFGSELAGIWTDLGEPERHPSDMYHHLGSTAKVHNVYNLLWAQAISEGFQQFRPNKRLFNLTRSGFAGIQRYGVIPWSGDVGKGFGGLAVQLPMLLNMGMSGLAYHNSDIGGFCCGTTTPELYARWMQYGTFCPIARAHGVDAQPTEPWGFGDSVEAICKKFIQLRYRLLPYIYTMAYENYSTGIPLARPFFFDDPNDQALVSESSSYLWGDEFLVSPVVQSGVISKTVYLPSGGWIDFWTDQNYAGGRQVTVSAPLTTMPLFVRSGSIIPMQPVVNYTEERSLDTLILEMYPDSSESGSFTLYEDDGKTLDYQSGSFAQTTFTQQLAYSRDSLGIHSTLTIDIGNTVGSYTGKLLNRTYLCEIHRISGEPKSVMNNGNSVTPESSLVQLRQAGEGYYYEDSTHRLFVQVAGSTDSTYHIQVASILNSTGVNGIERPRRFWLGQNYPNPFNPSTRISYEVPEAVHVTLAVYNSLGEKIATLVDGKVTVGRHDVVFDASSLPTGDYFYKFSAGDFSETKKLTLLK